MNIGITLSFKSETQSVWQNGIIQNVIYFYRLLKNSEKNYNVILLNTNEEIKTFNKLTWLTDDIKITNISESINDIDLLIMMGSQILDTHAKIVKGNNGKLVSYYCGNHYIMEMERVLFNKDSDRVIKFSKYYDDIWIIPQLYNTNRHYFNSLHGVDDSKCVPFIWDSYFIDKLKPQLDNNGEYNHNTDVKRIATFEPNINVVKFCMYPILIYDYFHKNYSKDSIEHMYVTNATRLRENKLFTSLMNHLDVFKDKKLSFDARLSTPVFLSKYTDVVIEHQWENPLNYLYLDVAYLGYPLIHNAHMVSDLGYYYEEYDVEKAAQHLDYVIREHNNNIDGYRAQTNKVLDRYRPTNKKSIMVYDKLIKDLFS